MQNNNQLILQGVKCYYYSKVESSRRVDPVHAKENVDCEVPRTFELRSNG